MLWTLPFLIAACPLQVIAFSPLPIPGRDVRYPTVSLRSTSEDVVEFQEDSLQSSTINGETPIGGGLVSMSDDTKSQLFSAFTALELPDQYDAVLTGLCAKILDDIELTEEKTRPALEDPMQLLDEMNKKRIAASARSLMALVDSSVKAQDAKTMAKILSLARRNGGILEYGALQTEITQLPTSPTSRVRCPDGTMKTREERLLDVPDIPTDDRAIEVRNALATLAVLGGCLFSDLAHFDSITPLTNIVLGLMVIVGSVDNFYDLLKMGASFAASQVNKEKAEEDKTNFELPEKDSLPFGLGSGQLTGSVVRGLARLFTVDAERECQVEAAALFAAYSLGLPCFAFRPNALESSVLVIKSTKENIKEIDSLDSSSGVMRMLIWLLAPVAMENQKYTQLIMSDPREAEGFLKRLEDYSITRGKPLESVWWGNDENERSQLLKWAFTEADLLLRDNRRTVSEISQCLTGGAATIGDCVALMEKW